MEAPIETTRFGSIEDMISLPLKKDFTIEIISGILVEPPTIIISLISSFSNLASSKLVSIVSRVSLNKSSQSCTNLARLIVISKSLPSERSSNRITL